MLQAIDLAFQLSRFRESLMQNVRDRKNPHRASARFV
jgi:hypothetical protein